LGTNVTRKQFLEVFNEWLLEKSAFRAKCESSSNFWAAKKRGENAFSKKRGGFRSPMVESQHKFRISRSP